jgi:hypothetical protein
MIRSSGFTIRILTDLRTSIIAIKSQIVAYSCNKQRDTVKNKLQKNNI